MQDLWLTSEKIYSKPACSENTDQTSTSRVEKIFSVVSPVCNLVCSQKTMIIFLPAKVIKLSYQSLT